MNAYFWEPGHATLTRFLRARRDTIVVAGTYHAFGATASAIVDDVDRTLRRLRRDAIDLFLLFVLSICSIFESHMGHEEPGAQPLQHTLRQSMVVYFRVSHGV